jgi:hypothetical protein
MKLKEDFVTNSSSSSFVALGATFERSEFFKANIQKIKEIYEKDGRVLPFDPTNVTYDDIYDLYDEMWEIVEDLMAGTELECSFRHSDSDYLMIGVPYTSMPDDETMGQFKERVQKLLEDFGHNGRVHHIEECWMDY